MARVIRPFDLLLDARSGWRADAVSDAVADATPASLAAGAIELRPLERLLPELNDPGGTFGGHTLAPGVATRGDHVFIADPARHQLLRWRPCCGQPAPLPGIGGPGSEPRELDTPRGLAIDRWGDLVVVDSGNRRLQVFTLPGLALRRIIGPLRSPPPGSASAGSPPPGSASSGSGASGDAASGDDPAAPAADSRSWQPLDVAADPRGRLYVADGAGRIWRLDAQGRPDERYPGVLPDGFIPLRLHVDANGRAFVIGSEPGDPLVMLDRFGVAMPDPARLERAVAAWLATHLPQPSASSTFEQEAEARAALLPGELSVAIDVELNRHLSELAASRPRTRKAALWAEVRDAAYQVDPPGVIPRAYQTHLRAFLESVLEPGRLTLLPRDQHQRMLAWLRERGLDADDVQQLRRAHDALALPEPPGRSAPTGHVLLRSEGPCPRPPLLTDLVVDEQGRFEHLPLLHRPPVASFEREGLYRSEPLDGRHPGNPWHRVALELSIPERTSVRLFSFTSDVPRPDLPAAPLLSDPPRLGQWQGAVDNVDEWLIQSPPGRYLTLALVLKGPGDRTPTVERIYLYARRQSSLRFLPALYQEDETSRHLLDRLLSLFDTVFAEIESQIEEFPRYLDAAGAPDGFLPWLASWFDLRLEQSWTEAQQRAFLRHAVELYAWRGTVRGMKRLLQLHAGLEEPFPYIVEHGRAAADPGRASEPRWTAAHAQLLAWLGSVPDAANHFTVLLPARVIDTAAKREVVRRLIDASKPAHTHYTLRPTLPGGGALAGDVRGRASAGDMRGGASTGPASTSRASADRAAAGRAPAPALGLDSSLARVRPWRLPAADAEPQLVPDLPRLLAGDPPSRLGRAPIGRARLHGRGSAS